MSNYQIPNSRLPMNWGTVSTIKKMVKWKKGKNWSRFFFFFFLQINNSKNSSAKIQGYLSSSEGGVDAFLYSRRRCLNHCLNLVFDRRVIDGSGGAGNVRAYRVLTARELRDVASGRRDIGMGIWRALPLVLRGVSHPAHFWQIVDLDFTRGTSCNGDLELTVSVIPKPRLFFFFTYFPNSTH